MSTWTLKEKSTGELITELEGESWVAAQKKAFDKLAKEVEIPGFRKGQAPKKLVEKQVSTQRVMLEAIDSLANEALIAGIKEHDVQPVARPTLDIVSLDETKAVIKFILTVKPEVQLGEYKGLAYEVKEVTVSDEEVETEINNLVEKFAEMEEKEGAVANGDTANINYSGFLNEEQFAGGTAEGHDLVIGSGSFIPGFEEQVIGMNVNEEKDINVTFPEEYHSEDLKGKEVVFKVKVNSIKTKVLPEVNDEFAKDVNIKDVDSVETLKAHIKEDLLKNRQQDAENQGLNDLITKVVDNATIELPQPMIDDECDQMINEFASRMQQQGLQLEQFLQMTNQKMEDLRAQFATDAESKVKLRLVLEAIAKAENLEVTTEEIETEYTKIADQYKMEVEKVKEVLPTDSLSYDVKLRKAYDLIKESASK